MVTTSFLDNASKCAHKNISNNYDATWECPTPYCSASEYYCLDCKAYVSACSCGFENYLSGWPRSRRRKPKKKFVLINHNPEENLIPLGLLNEPFRTKD